MRATSRSDAEAPSSCTLARRPCCDGELRRRTAVVEVLDARRLTGKAPGACAGDSGKGGRGETVVGTDVSTESGAGSDRDALEEAMECDVVIELSKKMGCSARRLQGDASHGVKYRRCAFPIKTGPRMPDSARSMRRQSIRLDRKHSMGAGNAQALTWRTDALPVQARRRARQKSELTRALANSGCARN